MTPKKALNRSNTINLSVQRYAEAAGVINMEIAIMAPTASKEATVVIETIVINI